MSKNLRAVLSAAALGLAATAVLPLPASRAAVDRSSFSFSIAGIRVGAASFEFQQSGSSYSAATRIDTAGVVGMLTDFFFDGQASGRLASGGEVVPQLFTATSKSPRALRKSRIEWKDGTPVKVSVEPPRDSAPDPAEQGGTLDPVSASLRLLRDAPASEILQHDGHGLRRLAGLAAQGGGPGGEGRAAGLRRRLRPPQGRGVEHGRRARVSLLDHLRPHRRKAWRRWSGSRRRPTSARRSSRAWTEAARAGLSLGGTLREADVTDFARTRSLFHLPEGVVYLDGNSLGPLPKAAVEVVNRTMREEWGEDLDPRLEHPRLDRQAARSRRPHRPADRRAQGQRGGGRHALDQGLPGAGRRRGAAARAPGDPVRQRQLPDRPLHGPGADPLPRQRLRASAPRRPRRWRPPSARTWRSSC